MYNLNFLCYDLAFKAFLELPYGIELPGYNRTKSLEERFENFDILYHKSKYFDGLVLLLIVLL